MNTLNTSSRHQSLRDKGNHRAEIVTIHANFLTGNIHKYLRLYANGLWYANANTKENGTEFYDHFKLSQGFNPKPTDMYVTHDRRYFDGKCSNFEPIFGVGEYANGTGLHVPNDIVIRDRNGGAETYILENNTKRLIHDLHTFICMGRDFDEVVWLDHKVDWDVIPYGKTIVI